MRFMALQTAGVPDFQDFRISPLHLPTENLAG
jgi:hypothetical protein